MNLPPNQQYKLRNAFLLMPVYGHLLQELAEQALAGLQPRVVSFDEQVALFRENLATVYQFEGNPVAISCYQSWCQALVVLCYLFLRSAFV